jgi:hypothetical protein
MDNITHYRIYRFFQSLSVHPKLCNADYTKNYLNSAGTNKCIILQSVYYVYYLASVCFSIIANFRELTPKYHYNVQQ